jgi:hypothetical protein
MNILILGGDFDTCLTVKTKQNPKIMVEIRKNLLIWHIMKNYDNGVFNYINLKEIRN